MSLLAFTFVHILLEIPISRLNFLKLLLRFEHIKTFTEEHSMLDLAPTFGLLGTMIKQQASIYLFVISQVIFYFPHPFTIFFFIFFFSPLPSSRVSATQASARPSLLCVRLTRQSLQDQKFLLLQKQASTAKTASRSRLFTISVNACFLQCVLYYCLFFI
jgi:hypothetical protein